MADQSTAPEAPAQERARPWGSEARAAPSHRRRHHWLAVAISALATLIGLIFLLWLLLFVTKGRFLKRPFERIASSYTHRQVRVAGDFNLYFDPITLKFLAEGLTVSNPGWASKPNLFQSKLVDTRIETIPLIFGTRHLAWLELADGAVDLEWDKAHQHNTWTFGAPETKGQPFHMPLIRRARVTGTTARYRDPRMQFIADVAFDAVRATNSRFDNVIRFTGQGSLRGEPFTLSGQQTSPNELVAGGRNQFVLHADGTRTHLDISGTLAEATQIDGADLSVAVRGQNLRNLFDLVGLAVPDTRAYRLTSHLTKQGDDYRFTRLAGRYGNSDLEGSFTVTVPAAADARTRLTADLSSRHVDIVDVGPFVGYNPTALAAKGAKAAVQQTGGVPHILPDAPLRIDAIRGFDAHVRYKVATITQPFVPVSNIVLGLDLDHALLKLDPLNFDLAGGHVSSKITIDARRPAVVTDYDVHLSPTPIGKLFYKTGVEDAGTTGVITARAKLRGTGNTLRDSLANSNGRIAIILPHGTFWTKYIQLSEFDLGVFLQKLLEDKLKKPVEVNCGLIGFTVRDGIAAADPILIDTTKNVMTAKGGFSFRDESIDLAFRADAKKFSLFSGQSPVGIGGHFADPKMQIITPALLARAGVGVALGVVASPVAALLAFVDPGDAKAAACGPVLAGAHAAAQRTKGGKPRTDVGTGKTSDVTKEKHGKFLGM